MGKQFIDIHTTANGLKIGLLRPSLLDIHNSYINAYTQCDCVIRFAVDVASTTAAVSLLLVSPGGDEVETYITFARSDVQYYDMTEPLRCWLQRNAQNYTIAQTCSEYALKVTEYDGNGTEIDTTGYVIRAYDAPEPVDTKFSAALPDTFRLLKGASFSGTLLACVRAVTSDCPVEVVLASGTVQTSLTGTPDDLYSAGWLFLHDPADAPAIVNVGSGQEMQSARVEWIDCSSDKMQLRWWSPLCGGYKSVAVELVSTQADKGEDAAYIRDFDDVFASAMSEGVKARVPLCTPRDVMYYRDIYISDEVEVIWDANVYSYNKRVRIIGTPPEVKANETADLEFVMKLQEVGMAW